MYSPSDGKCVQYIYGGCSGTKNLFDTESECRAACSGKSSFTLKKYLKGLVSMNKIFILDFKLINSKKLYLVDEE